MRLVERVIFDSGTEHNEIRKFLSLEPVHAKQRVNEELDYCFDMPAFAIFNPSTPSSVLAGSNIIM